MVENLNEAEQQVIIKALHLLRVSGRIQVMTLGAILLTIFPHLNNGNFCIQTASRFHLVVTPLGCHSFQTYTSVSSPRTLDIEGRIYYLVTHKEKKVQLSQVSTSRTRIMPSVHRGPLHPEENRYRTNVFAFVYCFRSLHRVSSSCLCKLQPGNFHELQCLLNKL